MSRMMNKDLFGVTDDLDKYPQKLGQSTRKGAPRPPSAAAAGRGGRVSAKKGKSTVGFGKYSSDQTDKIYELERENTALQSKENLLGDELTKMRTKLQRIEGLMIKMNKQRNVNSLSQDLLPSTVYNQLQEEINRMTEENDAQREKNRKLTAIEKELNIKNVTHKVPGARYGHVRGKLNVSKNKKSDQEFRNLVEELRAQLLESTTQIHRLATKRDRLQRELPANSTNELQRDLEVQQQELIQITKQIQEMRSDRIADDAMFKEQKKYIEEKQKEMQDLEREINQLERENLQIRHKAQMAKELTEDLENLKKERDDTEKQITNITARPFLKSKDDQKDSVKYASELETKLNNAIRLREKQKHEEIARADELETLKAKVAALRGEHKYIKGQHEEAKKKIKATRDDLTTGDIHRGLYEMDKGKFAQALGDMATRPDTYQIWKDVEFLERPTDAKEKDPKRSTNIETLKHEIIKMKHENKDLAAELDKHQSLLKLQTDIERENRQYFDQEKKRLEVQARSTRATASEMAKKLQEQYKQIEMLQRALGQGVPQLTAQERAQRALPADVVDMDHDFEIQIDEELRSDENYFDLRIVEAEFQQELIEQFLRTYGGNAAAYKDFSTVVMVNFYDHDTKTTEMCQGYRPKYQSQISYKNKIDSFYVQYLSKNRIKLQIYLAEGGKNAIELGTCETLLSDLVYRENIMSDGIGQKPATIEKWLNIIPHSGFAAGLGSRGATNSLGSLRIKMRLRKPIRDAVRHFENLQDVNALTTKSVPGKVTAGGKCMVIIQVVGCKDLKVSNEGVTPMAPFFYYQFYTFDERYSHTAEGRNPKFNDNRSYTLDFDAGAIKYFETQTLDIILFDNEAPLTGIEAAGPAGAPDEDVNDMIGIARVKLADLAKGQGISGDFDVLGLSNKDYRGKITMKIAIVDAQAGSAESQMQAQKDISDIHKSVYNNQWEQDIILRIATKLGRLSIDVELMFGIFSRGTKSCTKEDFKYQCLNRLNLKDQLTNKELDLFLNNHFKLKDKNNVQQKDFVEIFSAAITAARNAAKNQQALERTLFAKQTEQTQQPTSDTKRHRHGPVDYGTDYQRRDAVGVLVQCILKSSYDEIRREAERWSRVDRPGQLETNKLRKVLQDFGGITDFETQKVLTYLSVDGGVSAQRFVSCLDDAKRDARSNSSAVQKFDYIVHTQGQVLAEMFMSKDINLDGCLTLDGFKSSVIGASELSEYKIELAELKEIFDLISRDGYFYYAEYIMEIDYRNRAYFTKLKLSEGPQAPVEASMIVDKSLDHSNSILQASFKQSQRSNKSQHEVALRNAIKKIEQFMISNDVTTSVVFNVLDSNSDSKITKSEFKSKLRGLQLGLEEQELEALFKDTDANNDGTVNYHEFIKQFTAINATQILKKLRSILYESSITAEYIFNKFCKGNSLNKQEFRSLIGYLNERLAEFEVDSMFNQLDTKDGSKDGSIPKQKFLDWFGYDQSAQMFQTGIEDIIKPLVTSLKRVGKTANDLFYKYDQNKNQLMSATELQGALKDMLKFEMTADEVKTMQEFFRFKYKRVEIKKHEFNEIINKPYKRQYESGGAQSALKTIREKLHRDQKSIDAVLANQVSQLGEVSLRAFKLAIHRLGVLTQPQINNLAKYMERFNNGMIKIADVHSALDGRYDPATKAER